MRFVISQHSNAANGAARGAEVYYSVNIPRDKEFAGALSKAVSEVMGNPNRGAKIRVSTKSSSADYYTVISEAQKAGAKYVLLIENGFHDNLADEAVLLKDENLKAIAEAQAKVICKFIGGLYVEESLPNVGNVDIVENSTKFDLFGQKQVDIKGSIVDGITHVQARHLLEEMGFTVDWDDKTKTMLVGNVNSFE